MAGHDDGKTGPDLSRGVSPSEIPESGLLQGHVGEDTVLLARSGGEYFAIGGTCTHYSGPLAEGMLSGDTVCCPWHHARFSLRSDNPLRTPALSAVSCWSVAQRDGKIFVTGKKDPAPSPKPQATDAPSTVVILSGGAAGFAAAEMLRRMSFSGGITMISDDHDAPVDRPNLSKDFLAG